MFQANLISFPRSFVMSSNTEATKYSVTRQYVDFLADINISFFLVFPPLALPPTPQGNNEVNGYPLPLDQKCCSKNFKIKK